MGGRPDRQRRLDGPQAGVPVHLRPGVVRLAGTADQDSPYAVRGEWDGASTATARRRPSRTGRFGTVYVYEPVDAGRVRAEHGASSGATTRGARGSSCFWLTLLFLMMLGFSYSFFWSAATMIYFLMRKRVDEAELDEVFLEDEEPEAAARPAEDRGRGRRRSLPGDLAAGHRRRRRACRQSAVPPPPPAATIPLSRRPPPPVPETDRALQPADRAAGSRSTAEDGRRSRRRDGHASDPGVGRRVVRVVINPRRRLTPRPLALLAADGPDAPPVLLFSGPWADLPLDALAAKAAGWGYAGFELAAGATTSKCSAGSATTATARPGSTCSPATTCRSRSSPTTRSGRPSATPSTAGTRGSCPITSGATATRPACSSGPPRR